EMRIERAGWRQMTKLRFRDAECPLEKTPRAACIDQESRPRREGSAIAPASHGGVGRVQVGLLEADVVEVIDAGGLRFLKQEIVEVAPVPVSVRNRVMRAGRDKEFVVAVCARSPCLVQRVMVEGEAP